MSTIKKLNSAIDRAKSVVEAAAAAVDQLTRDSKVEETTFTIPAAGVNFNQLVTELRKLSSPTTEAVKEGEIIRIKTTNPTATTKVLKYLGISASVDGTVNSESQPTAPDTTL